jgi:hypothetical protein
MQKVTATISDGQTVIVQGAEAWVQGTSSAGGTPGWRGRIVLPPGLELPEGGSYNFRTSDGHAGRILIDRIVASTRQHTVLLFTGEGPYA